MKVLAVNGSPRKRKSNTDKLLLPFLEGAKEAGAEVELHYLQEMDIKPCLGCFNCWLKTPGKCVQHDDMEKLLPAVADADLQVMATPLYVCGVSGQMKTMMDRIVPLAQPFIEDVDGTCSHPHRDGVKCSKWVLISNCGFYEMEHFDALVAHMKSVAKVGRREFMAALLRPQGEMMAVMDKFAPDKVAPVYEAAKEAGRQAVAKGSIDDDVLAEFSRDFVPRDEFIKAANQYFQAQIDRIKK